MRTGGVEASSIAHRRTTSLLAHLGGRLDGLELDVAHETFCLARVDQSRLHAARRLGAARDAEAQALVGSAAFVARAEVPREERVARAPPRDRLARLDARAFEPR